MGFLISDSIAAEVTSHASAGSDNTYSFVMMAVIFVLFYLLLIRPQNKRAKAHRLLIEQLKQGDEVLTSSGVLGKIVSLRDQYVVLSLVDGVDVYFQKSAIASILPKGTLKTLKTS